MSASNPEPKTAIWQFCLEGFDGGTSDTDHLVKWVKAHNQEDVEELVSLLGFKISTRDPSDDIDRTALNPDFYFKEDGVDYDLTDPDWRTIVVA